MVVIYMDYDWKEVVKFGKEVRYLRSEGGVWATEVS